MIKQNLGGFNIRDQFIRGAIRNAVPDVTSQLRRAMTRPYSRRSWRLYPALREQGAASA